MFFECFFDPGVKTVKLKLSKSQHWLIQMYKLYAKVFNLKAKYYFGSMLIISLATAATVLTLNIAKKGYEDEPVPQLIQKIFFDFIAKVVFITIKSDRRIKLPIEDLIFSSGQNVNDLKEKIRSSGKTPVDVNKMRTDNEYNDYVCHLNKGSKKDNLNKNSNSSGSIYSESEYLYSIPDPVSNKLLLKASPGLNMSSSNIKRSYTSNECKQNQYQSFDNVNRLRMKYNNNYLNPDDSRICAVASSKHNNDLMTKSPGLERALSNKYNDLNGKINAVESQIEITTEKKRLTKLLKSVNDNLERNEIRELVNGYKEQIKNQWNDLAKVIDAVMLYIFVISTFLMFAIMIFEVPKDNFTIWKIEKKHNCYL